MKKIYELSGKETESLYSYDGFNRLTAFVSVTAAAEYTYNPDGLRESKTVNGNPTRYLYSGADIVGELTADNCYLYYRGTELLGSTSHSGAHNLYKLDTHGNVASLLDADGSEIKSYTYNAYGREKVFEPNPEGSNTILYYWKNETTNSAHNPFRYCGEYFDEETGLIYLRNRCYDPSIGRFITEDPIKDGLNWYVYCGNNPGNRWDPWGLEESRDKEVLTKKDYEHIQMLTAIYNYVRYSLDDMSIADEAHREAMKIRQKPEYAGLRGLSGKICTQFTPQKLTPYTKLYARGNPQSEKIALGIVYTSFVNFFKKPLTKHFCWVII